MPDKTIDIIVNGTSVTVSDAVAGNAGPEESVSFRVAFPGGTWLNLHKRMMIQSPKGTLCTTMLLDENGCVTAPSGALDGEGSLVVTLLGTSKPTSDYEIIYRAAPVTLQVLPPLDSSLPAEEDNLLLNALYLDVKTAAATANTSAAQSAAQVTSALNNLSTRLSHGEFIGAKGDKGEQGDKGDKGDTGETGPAGPPCVLTIGTVETGELSSASITGEAPEQVLHLVLEKGEKGDPGRDGVDGIVSDTVAIGTVVEWFSESIPQNWLLCNGQAVSRADYSELFALWGTVYGEGDGSATFNLPDMEGRVTSPDTHFIVKVKQLIPLNAAQVVDSLTDTSTVNALSAGKGKVLKDLIDAIGPGTAATIEVGTVITGEPGSPAMVTNAGTENDAVLNFTIPSGAAGLQGIQGEQGFSDTLPIGSVVEWFSDRIPDHWLLCNGQMLFIASYVELFCILGNAYGGNGVTTFAVPNLNGRVAVGRDATTDFDVLGKTGGERTHTLTVAEGPIHNHNENAHSHSIDHDHGPVNTGYETDYNSTWGLEYLTVYTAGGTQATTHDDGNPNVPATADGYHHAHTVDLPNFTGVSGSTTSTNQNAGGGGDHNNLQPYIVSNFIIKAKLTPPTSAVVIDSLTSTSSTDALSANQGKALKELVDANTVSIEVGTVTTGESGTDAIITNGGTSSAASFNFTIPRGAPGAIASDTPPTDMDIAVWVDTSSDDTYAMEVIDSLDSTSTTDALSAKQGKVLSELKSDKSGVLSPITLSNGTDLDSCTTPGKYAVWSYAFAQTILHKPLNYAFMLEVETLPGPTYMQTFTSYTANAWTSRYFRWSFSGGGWSEWQTFSMEPSTGYDGWNMVRETWTYASANTVTVPSGAAGRYQKGDKVRYKQGGGWKYAYIMNMADTLLTVSGGVDYTVSNAAVSDVYISKASSPQGFPGYFRFAPTIIASTSNPTVTYASQRGRFTIEGRLAVAMFDVSLASVSGGSGAVQVGNLPFAVGGNSTGAYSKLFPAEFWNTTGISVDHCGAIDNGSFGSLVFLIYNGWANRLQSANLTNTFMVCGEVTSIID